MVQTITSWMQNFTLACGIFLLELLNNYFKCLLRSEEEIQKFKQ